MQKVIVTEEKSPIISRRLRFGSSFFFILVHSDNHKSIRLDEMLGAEIGAEVHDLPGPEADEEPGGADAEPLDARVCALVGVAELLLAAAEVLHLLDDLGGELLDAAQVGLGGLELVVGLDGGPVAGVGANLDVELDLAGGGGGAVGWKRVSRLFLFPH